MMRHSHHISYVVTAGACLVLHNVVLILADAAGYPLVLGMLTSFVIVAIFGYALHSLITFREPLSWGGLHRYVSAMSVNIVAAFAITWLCKNGLRLPMSVAAPLASVLMLASNFLLSRWAIVPAKPTE